MRREAPWMLPALLAAALVLASCAGEPRVALDTLLLRDSLYLAPETEEPFTGRVYRAFPGDMGRMELEGRLEDGSWEGELTVYHPGGSIRYQGRLSGGTPCGAWVENREEGADASLYQELVREIESMGLYPPCPER